jgi:hypothetical protein
MARKREPVQRTLTFPTWGGARAGAGRPKSDGAGVTHDTRPTLSRCSAVHVTLRMLPHVWSLRSRRSEAVFRRALDGVHEREDFRVVHYAVQGDHVHHLDEADGASALARGMQALTIRLAKGLNRMMGRRGEVFADRYHAHALRTPREVRNALAYVLLNRRSHLARLGARELPPGHDPFSSGAAFDGWVDAPSAPSARAAPPTSAAQGWLLQTGWRRHGLLSTQELPALAEAAVASTRRPKKLPRRT